MTRLRTLINEVLSTPPKKKDCGCGCNTCEGKSPVLTEGKVKKIISEDFQYHVDKKIPLHESVYRIGSKKHFALINEARILWVRGLIDVSEDDQAILETHLGNFGMYEGEKVPLDMPMVNEGTFQGNEVAIYGGEDGETYIEKRGTGYYGYNNSFDFTAEDKADLKQMLSGWGYYPIAGSIDENLNEVHKLLRQTNLSSEEYQKAKKLKGFNADDYTFNSDNNLYVKEKKSKFKKHGEMSGFDMRGINEATRQELGMSSSVSKSRAKAALKNPSNDGSKVYGLDKNGKRVELKSINDIDKFKKFEIDADLNEAEFKGKDVELNKPKRGGSKAYYVYVRDPKTKKIKKVSFGSGGLRAKIKNKEARNAFAARHNCKNKKDRTKAGYWSCNLPRYAEQLGLGSKMNTFW